MNEVDVGLRQQLDRLVPSYGPPDWKAVLDRAGRSDRGRHRRWLLIAAAATAVAVGVGVAVAAALGGFSSWLSGEPGKPAPPAEQRAFERANAHSFLGFPPGTQLRQLLRSAVSGGPRVDLFGFRTASTLCLRLVVVGKARAEMQSCAPLTELRRPGSPVRVLVVDHGFGRGTKAAWYGVERLHSSALQATAGIVADGVRNVIVEDESGRHTLPVAANAFLYVARNPEVGQRVTRISAVRAGRSTPVPLAPAPFAGGGPVFGGQAATTGPTRVDRKVVGGTIGWLLRHEPRGEPLSVLPSRTRTFVQRHTVFGRLIAPDPGRPLRVAVTLSSGPQGGESVGVCTWLVLQGGAGGGCSPRADLFARGPVTVGTSLEDGSDEFLTASGLASDDVSRIVAYLANGQQLPVPLADNAYAVQLPRSELPAKLVAYDGQGRVIGLSDPIQDVAGGGSPARGKAQLLLRAVSPTGSAATMLVGKSTSGGECWYVRWYRSKRVRGLMSNCTDLARPAVPLQLGTIGSPPQFLVGRVYRTVADVELRYADGARASVEPTRMLVLYAIPHSHLAAGHGLVSVVAHDAGGREIGSEPLTPPRR